MAYRALLFDLFGTVVHFVPDVPTITVGGTTRRTTMAWLRPAVEQVLPGMDFDALLAALLAVTQEVIQARVPEYYEVPSRERFRRALVRLGVEPAATQPAAERLSLVHMEHLASLTVLPSSHPVVFDALAATSRLALVSNFDHGATARRVLAIHNVAAFFDPIVISEEFGRRKPHPSIFLATLERLGVAPEEALFIGDSTSEDVAGAHAAGLPTAWVNPAGDPLPAGIAPPRYVVRELAELLDLVR